MQKPQLQYLQNYDWPHVDQHVDVQFAGVDELLEARIYIMLPAC